jgi:hypothetical protein
VSVIASLRVLIILVYFQSGNPSARNALDKDALQAKVARKQEEKRNAETEAAQTAVNKKVEPKRNKAKKESDNLDDLLLAGLSKGKAKK